MKQFIYGAVLCLVALAAGWYMGASRGRSAVCEELVAAGVVDEATIREVLSTQGEEDAQTEPDILFEGEVEQPRKTKSNTTATDEPKKKMIDNKDVEMVHYQQNDDDLYAYISLKNNTERDIKRIQFRIIYYDTKGNQLDYKDFNIREDIAPGLVRKLDITNFRRSESFDSYYYKSRNKYNVHARPYKITYQLLDYR